ncbi:MAG: hypothetical protein H8E44_44690 [Planctomycetes bacterium]|nr:hypothetical protein [Planctomycetota bacterium]
MTMRKYPASRKVALCLAAITSMAGTFVHADAASAAEQDEQKVVPLKTKLPKPMFQGTPKNIKLRPTLEKYSEKPRPPFYVPEGVQNLALKKPVTASDRAPIIGELDLVTDGVKEGFDGCYVEFAPGTQWVQIDLGAAADIFAILVWHYHAEGRVYHDVVIQTADDPDFILNVQTVFNSDLDNSSGLGLGRQREYIDDFRGKLIDAKNKKGEPVRGRYVRLYSKGNTSNDLNHYVEVEVYGKPAS